MINLSSAFKFTGLNILLLLFAVAGNAQAVITGTVKDENGNLLSGASVSVQGTSTALLLTIAVVIP
jgi:hypothetical protein